MQLEILDASSHKRIVTLENVSSDDSVGDIKHEIYLKKTKLYPDRQSLRLEPRGKSLKDEEKLFSLKLPSRGAQLYLRDLGAQIGWKTVFLIEYFGPFVIYPAVYMRPGFLYGSDDAVQLPVADVVHLACACWVLHYGKRLLETLFVHRFSHGTMPLMNVFKNSGYYWGFAFFVAYFVNHPLYTPPTYGRFQIGLGLCGFLAGECGNFAIHMALRNLRPEGTKERKIPVPTGNPFTALFHFVSCPNYTYEVKAWMSFAIMTQCLPALIFALVGFGQMTIWAIGKHKNYKKEFPSYPKGRKAIIPFVI